MQEIERDSLLFVWTSNWILTSNPNRIFGWGSFVYKNASDNADNLNSSTLFAAGLEAGGDVLVQIGLNSTSAHLRFLLFASGGLVLFVYGFVVNAAP